MIPNLTNFNKCIACSIVLASLALGAVITNRLTQTSEARAAGDRVFELRVYHAVPGKLPVMESRFREKTSKILARHNLNVVGYWIADEAPDNSFVFLFSHDSRDDAKKNWDAFRLDPEFQEVVKSEQGEKTLEKADIIWLRSTDFSPMK
jgi:NIPSNAP protein